METALSIKNDAVLKCARRWIITAYVWDILYTLFSWFVVPKIIRMLMEQYGLYFSQVAPFYSYLSIIGNGIFLICIIIAFIKLKSHTNSVLRQASKLFIAAFVVNFIILQMNIYAGISKYIYETTAILFLPFLTAFLLTVVTYYLFIMSYTHLSKCSTLIKTHSEIPILYILTFLYSTSSIYNCTLLFIWINLKSYMWGILGNILSYIFGLGILILFIICWKRLFRTPSNIPDTEEKEIKITFVPSKAEVGYLISLLLFTGIVYAMVYYISIQ